MNHPFPLSGDLNQIDLASILFQMHAQAMHGLVRLHFPAGMKIVGVEDQRIMLVRSNEPGDAFLQYLLRNHLVSEESRKKILQDPNRGLSLKTRSLLEMGVLNEEQLWDICIDRQLELLSSLFAQTSCHYDIQSGDLPEEEGTPRLYAPIPSTILQCIRKIHDESFVSSRFQNRDTLYPADSHAAAAYPLKPYEWQVLHLVKRHRLLGEILKKSPLPSLSTLKILYFFLTVGILSYKSEPPPPQCIQVDRQWIPSFNSFEETLAYFNNRYEYIYRMLSKEIGPVAASILFDAVTSIQERVPSYLRQLHFAENGRLEEKPILKSLWYLNFEQTISELLTGLEEIFYAEIYAVKKHLGKEYEQQILQWMRENGGK